MIRTISVKDLWKVHFNESIRLLDLRDPEDYKEWHLPAARCYPYDQIGEWKKRLSKQPLYYLICWHGNSAMRAAAELERMGCRVVAVVGGYYDLQQEKKENG